MANSTDQLAAMVESCRAGNQPIRFDDETYDASQEYYARKHRRNTSDIDKARPYIVWAAAIALSCGFWWLLFKSAVALYGSG